MSVVQLHIFYTTFTVFLNEYNILLICLPWLHDFEEDYGNPLPVGHIQECFQVKQSPSQPLYKTTKDNDAKLSQLLKMFSRIPKKNIPKS